MSGKLRKQKKNKNDFKKQLTSLAYDVRILIASETNNVHH